MADKLLKMKYDKLLSELKFVEDDLVYHKSVMDEEQENFSKHFDKKMKELGLSIKPPTAPKKKQEKPKKKPRAKTKEMKDLFKKIATVTHPDKILELPLSEKIQKEKKFLEASEAAEEGRALSLHKIAKEVGIEIPEVSEIQLQVFEEEISNHREEIDRIKKTWLWIWKNAPTEEEKDSIISGYIKFLLTTGVI